jgi:hypothetical protein
MRSLTKRSRAARAIADVARFSIESIESRALLTVPGGVFDPSFDGDAGSDSA